MLTQGQARELANKLVARLGSEWYPVIHENLGWNARAKLTPGLYVVINVGYAGHKTTFSAFLNHPDTPGGGIWAKGADTPEEAIKLTLDAAQQEVDFKAAAIGYARAALESNQRATWEVPKNAT